MISRRSILGSLLSLPFLGGRKAKAATGTIEYNGILMNVKPVSVKSMPIYSEDEPNTLWDSVVFYHEYGVPICPDEIRVKLGFPAPRPR